MIERTEDAVQSGESGTTTRRAVLAGGGAVCLAVLLGACGGDDDGGTPGGAGTTAPPTTASNTGEPTDEPTDGGNADVLAKVSDVPSGGGKLVGTILLVKLADNSIKAYDAHCTHQGFIVDPPSGGTITCPNHGSQFQAADGSVTRGPAANPLRSIAVKVEGDNIVRA